MVIFVQKLINLFETGPLDRNRMTKYIKTWRPKIYDQSVGVWAWLSSTLSHKKTSIYSKFFGFSVIWSFGHFLFIYLVAWFSIYSVLWIWSNVLAWFVLPAISLFTKNWHFQFCYSVFYKKEKDLIPNKVTIRISGKSGLCLSGFLLLSKNGTKFCSIFKWLLNANTPFRHCLLYQMTLPFEYQTLQSLVLGWVCYFSA